MGGTYLPYIITEIYCIAFSVTILFHLNSSICSEHEVRLLRYMFITNITMIIPDLVLLPSEDGYYYVSAIVANFFDFIMLASVSLGCFFWFRYIEDRLQPKYIKNKYYKKLIFLPIIVVVVFEFVSIFNGVVFYTDDKGVYQYGPVFILTGIVDYFYLLIPTINAVINAITTHSKANRREYITYAAYMIAPLTAGIFEDYIPTVPILSLNIFLVINLLFDMIQSKQIYNDALTGLNNRSRLNIYLDDRIKNASERRPVTLFMIDVNRFKQINDEYGHLEGDNSLKLIATALRTAGDRYNGFVARYGGDEFCIITDGNDTPPVDIIKNITVILDKEQNNIPDRKYSVSVSIGYAVCKGEKISSSSLVKEADESLYLYKQQWHRDNDK